jgi:hypothetical protein
MNDGGAAGLSSVGSVAGGVSSGSGTTLIIVVRSVIAVFR